VLRIHHAAQVSSIFSVISAVSQRQDSSGPPLLRDPLLYGVVLIRLAACTPFFRYVGSLGDEGVLLHGAVRILGGEVLYRDVFGILPPGGYLIVTCWMKLFGVGFASVRALAVGVIVGIAALIYAAARLSSGSRPLAAMVAIAWAVLSPGVLTVINHHWFTTAASMASAVGLLLVVDGAPRRGAAFAAGLFAGIAAMVSSTRGALMCVTLLAVLLTLRTGRARLVSALAGMAFAPTVMVLHVAGSAALAAAFDDVILYPAFHYAGIQAVPFGMGASPQHLALVALFPVAFVLAGVALALNRVAMWHDPRFRVSLALAIVGLLGSYPRPDLIHIAFTVPLACPLFALATVELRGPGRIAVAALFGGLCLVGLAGVIATAVVVSRLPAVATARGPIVPDRDLPARDLAALMLRLDSIPTGSAFFFYPYSPLLPYLTGRHHAAAVDVMIPGYTSAEQFRETCVRVANEVEWVVIDRKWTPNVFRTVFPAMRDPDPPEKRDFEAALRVAFDKIVHASTRFELRERSGHPPAVACDKI
jgi:hypothetical protein